MSLSQSTAISALTIFRCNGSPQDFDEDDVVDNNNGTILLLMMTKEVSSMALHGVHAFWDLQRRTGLPEDGLGAVLMGISRRVQSFELKIATSFVTGKSNLAKIALPVEERPKLTHLFLHGICQFAVLDRLSLVLQNEITVEPALLPHSIFKSKESLSVAPILDILRSWQKTVEVYAETLKDRQRTASSPVSSQSSSAEEKQRRVVAALVNAANNSDKRATKSTVEFNFCLAALGVVSLSLEPRKNLNGKASSLSEVLTEKVDKESAEFLNTYKDLDLLRVLYIAAVYSPICLLSKIELTSHKAGRLTLNNLYEGTFTRDPDVYSLTRLSIEKDLFSVIGTMVDENYDGDFDALMAPLSKEWCLKLQDKEDEDHGIDVYQNTHFIQQTTYEKLIRTVDTIEKANNKPEAFQKAVERALTSTHLEEEEPREQGEQDGHGEPEGPGEPGEQDGHGEPDVSVNETAQQFNQNGKRILGEYLLSSLPVLSKRAREDIPVPTTTVLPTVLVVTMRSNKTKTIEELGNVEIPVWPSISAETEKLVSLMTRQVQIGEASRVHAVSDREWHKLMDTDKIALLGPKAICILKFVAPKDTAKADSVKLLLDSLQPRLAKDNTIWAYDPAGPYTRATIGEILTRMAAGGHQSLESSYLPITNDTTACRTLVPFDNFSLFGSWETESYQWRTSGDTPTILGSKWLHLRSGFSICSLQHAPSGLCTLLDVTVGRKLVCIPKEALYGPDFAPSATCQWDVVLLIPGYKIIIPPGLPFVEVDLDSCVTIGGHFYSNSCLSESLDAITLHHYWQNRPADVVPGRELAPLVLFKCVDRLGSVVLRDESIEDIVSLTMDQIASLLVLVCHIDQLSPKGSDTPWQSTDKFKADHEYILGVVEKILASDVMGMLSSPLEDRERSYQERILALNETVTDEAERITFKFCSEAVAGL